MKLSLAVPGWRYAAAGALALRSLREALIDVVFEILIVPLISMLVCGRALGQRVCTCRWVCQLFVKGYGGAPALVGCRGAGMTQTQIQRWHQS